MRVAGLTCECYRQAMPRGEASSKDLAPPAVAPNEYDASYFLHSCIGADIWRESEGKKAGGIYTYALSQIDLQPGERLLDVGTGRGDLLPVALSGGAAEAVGVDYSADAIDLAKRTLRAHGDPPGARALLADARRIPVADAAYDAVTMLDVVEHLTPRELADAFAEILRALRPGGRLFVHTAPNALVYRVTYRLQRLLYPGRARRWPKDPRNDFEHRMHVNEQTPRSLAGALRSAGFGSVEVQLGQWVYTGFVPEPRAHGLYHRLARRRITRRFGVIDLFAHARKPSQE